MTSAMPSTMLKVARITKRFGGVVANDAISFEVATSTTHALIGPNGSGKSTLVAQLAGSMAPDSGEAFLEYVPLSYARHRHAHLGIARTHQIPSIYPHLTVRENLEIALMAHARRAWRFWQTRAERDTLFHDAHALLAELNLADKATERAVNLSYGDQKLLELAMALALAPKLLILDEPVAGLSPSARALVLAHLKTLKKQGVTMLLVEHDMAFVRALATTISVLNEGRILTTDTADAVAANPHVQAAYLGTSGITDA